MAAFSPRPSPRRSVRSLAGRDPAFFTRAIMACHYCALCHARRWRMAGLAPIPRRHYISVIMGAGDGAMTGGPEPLADFAAVKDGACATCHNFPPRSLGAGGKLCVLDRRKHLLDGLGAVIARHPGAGQPPAIRHLVISDGEMTLPPPPHIGFLSVRAGGVIVRAPRPTSAFIAGRGARIAINRAYLSRFGARCAKTCRRNHPPPLSGVAGGILRGGSPLYTLAIPPRQATSPPTGRRVVPHGGGRRGDE